MTAFFWIIEYIASFIEIFMCCVFCEIFLRKEEFLYKAKIGLCIVLPLIYAVILASIDFAVSYFTALILHVDANYLLNHQNFSRVLCILLSKFLLILIVVTLRKLLKKINNIYKKVYSHYVYLLCFSISFTFYYGGIEYKE